MKKKLQFIFRHAKKHKIKFIILFLTTIIATFIAAIYPYILGKLVDESIYGKNLNLFFRWVLIYFGAYMLAQVIYMAQNTAWAKLMVEFVFDIRSELFNKIINLKAKYLVNVNTGDLQNRINNDANQIMDLIHWDVFYLVANIIDLLASIYFVFLISPYISIYCIVAIPFIVMLTKKLSKKNKTTEKVMVEQRALLNSRLFEFLNGILDIKILSMSYNAIKHLVKIVIRIYREKIWLDRWLIVSERIMAGINLLSTMLIYLFSLFLIMKGHITIGGFVACTNYISRVTRLFSTINKYLTSIKVHSISIDRINEILDMDSEENVIYDKNTILKFNLINDLHIEFENVKFSYNADNPILKDVSFKIHYGEQIALVGESGAGKSTIINLICGLYDVDNGCIKINGYNIKKINLNLLRSQIGVVHQDIQLFNDTIRYNLNFGNPDLNDDILWDALDAAQLKQFVLDLPDQLDTIIGISGTTLSGGQKQRLAIARIFIKNPKLLIFDEATSSLDSEAEFAIQSSWERLSENRTVIIIAHRYSTIKGADKVMVIKNGDLVAFDCHDQLLKHCDYYRHLFQNQYAIYSAEVGATNVI